jgi:hypothetical protein
MGNPKADFSDLEDLRPRESNTVRARRGGVRGPVSLMGAGLTAGVSCSFTLAAFFPHDQARTLRAAGGLTQLSCSYGGSGQHNSQRVWGTTPGLEAAGGCTGQGWPRSVLAVWSTHPSWQSFDLGHDDYDRSIYRGPEHQHCNRFSAASRGNRMRGQRRRVQVRVGADDSARW